MYKLPAFQRFDGAADIDVDHSIELVRQRGEEVMADSFALWQVDDADGAFQPLLFQQSCRWIPSKG